MRYLILPALLVASTATAQQVPLPSRPDTVVQLDRIVAVVGDQPITRYDVRQKVNALLQEGYKRPTTDSATRAMEIDARDQLVEEELLLQQAKELKVETADADISRMVERTITEVRGKFASEAEYRGELVKAGLGTPEEYRRFLTEQLRRSQTITKIMEKLRQDNKLVPVNVTEGEVEAQFQRTKEFMPKRPPSVTFRQIVIAPQPRPAERDAARVKADSVLAQIKAGADFEAIAKRESMDEKFKATGGAMGWVRRGDPLYGPPPEVERYLFGDERVGTRGVPPGQVSPVVESPIGFHIFRIDKIQTGQVNWHQILILPKVDSADLTRAALIADSVATRLKAGAPFDTLARKYHDYAHKEETSLLTPFARDSLPPSYQKAFTGKHANDIVIFQIPGNEPTPEIPKLVVAQLVSVEEGGDMTLVQMRDLIRDQLAKQGAVRRYLDTLKRKTYVSVRPDTPSAPSAKP